MKHLQYFQKRQPASIAISSDAPESVEKSRHGNAMKSFEQTLAGADGSCNLNVAGRVRNYCMFILMLVLTSHAVVGKVKNSFGKNVLATKEGLKIMRVIVLAGRNIAPAQPQKIQSTIAAFVNHVFYGDLSERLVNQFMTVAPDLYSQIYSLSVGSDTVVFAL